MTTTVMIWVQNLLGVGHLRRAASVARAMVDRGMTVEFVTGGFPVPYLDIGGARLRQLPPLRSADQDFKRLLGDGDVPVDDAWRAARRDTLLALLEAIRPDVLITELFPFGRRQMRFELLPLIDKAAAMRPRPAIVSSMRDILVTKPRADRNQEIADTVERYYDRVLVHGDERVIALAETFPLIDRIAERVAYTGYVVTPFDVDIEGGAGPGAGEVVVSAGGGAVGGATMPAVFRLREALPMRDRVWRFVTGHHMPETAWRGMADAAAGRDDVIVERARPDLPSLIARADLSISQAGYNTVAELMLAGTPAVVVPFEGGVETEQRIRADLLAARGRLEVVPETALTPDALGAAMTRAAAGGRRPTGEVTLDGAARTAEIVRNLASRAAPGTAPA